MQSSTNDNKYSIVFIKITACLWSSMTELRNRSPSSTNTIVKTSMIFWTSYPRAFKSKCPCSFTKKSTKKLIICMTGQVLSSRGFARTCCPYFNCNRSTFTSRVTILVTSTFSMKVIADSCYRDTIILCMWGLKEVALLDWLISLAVLWNTDSSSRIGWCILRKWRDSSQLEV